MDKRIASEVYLTPENPGSYGGVQRLYNSLKEYGFTKKQTEDFLSAENSYTLHKNRRLHFTRNPILAFSKDYRWQCDLVDLQKYAKENAGYKYLLVVIDTFTKYLWIRAIKTKQPGDVKRAFENILEDGRKPLHLMSDKGGEFSNSIMRTFFENRDINYYTSWTSVKCSIVERVNKTIKSRMFRYFTHTGEHKYVHVLQKFVDSYNNSFHRSIKMSPLEATTSGSALVFRNLYPNLKIYQVGRQLRKGDIVRVAYDKTPFMKGYESTFSEETGKIVDINNRRLIPMYSLRDQIGKTLKRKFYSSELQAIKK